jgi:hypothetical protein
MISFDDWYDDPDNGVDKFGVDLAQAVANQFARVKPCDREQVREALQDHTSLYSAYVADLVEELLECKSE